MLMIDAVQNHVRSVFSHAMRVVAPGGKNQLRGKRGQHLAGTLLRLNLASLAGLFACLTLCLLSTPATASATTYNVVSNCGATGNGSTDDTAAINTCIGRLQAGDTLLFPQGTYKITSSLVIDVANVTVDGSSNTATIRAAFSGNMLLFGNPNGFCVGCSLGPLFLWPLPQVNCTQLSQLAHPSELTQETTFTSIKEARTTQLTRVWVGAVRRVRGIPRTVMCLAVGEKCFKSKV